MVGSRGYAEHNDTKYVYTGNKLSETQALEIGVSKINYVVPFREEFVISIIL